MFGLLSRRLTQVGLEALVLLACSRWERGTRQNSCTASFTCEIDPIPPNTIPPDSHYHRCSIIATPSAQTMARTALT